VSLACLRMVDESENVGLFVCVFESGGFFVSRCIEKSHSRGHTQATRLQPFSFRTVSRSVKTTMKRASHSSESAPTQRRKLLSMDEVEEASDEKLTTVQVEKG
jgi:hypothetical protein